MDKKLNLLRLELRKPSFVVNNVQEKVWFIEKYISIHNEIIRPVMTVLINLAVYDKAVDCIMKSNIIDILMDDEKEYDSNSFIWFMANIALTGPEYLKKLLNKKILNHIIEMDIYSEDTYNESLSWGLGTLIHSNNSEYHNTQLLDLMLDMDNTIIHNFFPSISKICRINSNLISTFILEGGLALLNFHFDNYAGSSLFLEMIFRYHKEDEDLISHIYNIFRSILMEKLNVTPTYEVYRIYMIVLEHMDVSKDILTPFIIDNLELNDTLLFYGSLELLSNDYIILNEKNVERIMSAIIKHNDDINIFNMDCYGDFFCKCDVLHQLKKYDTIEFREFIDDLDDIYKIDILNVIDDTLFKKCLTVCKDYEYNLPHHLRRYQM